MFFLFPAINFVLIDSDCVPVTLFEVQELWWSSTDATQPVTLREAEKTHETSSLAHSHKRARSVDTGRDTQQPGPPSKLSRSLSADNLEDATQLDTDKPSPVHDDFAAEVDYGSSPERTPPKKGTRTPSSTDRSPTRSHRPPPGSNKPDGTSAIMPCPKGVILVSEAFTEINAGFVVVLASMHTPPVPPRVLADPDLDPDEAVGAVVRAYHIHVETYLATTFPPVDVDQWVASGLLGSPLLGTATSCTADWCHAWSILGQWSGHVTFPVPASRVWPRHGHLRKILDAYQGRQPNFHKWARPAFEQGALPTLSILPGDVAIRVLPGDKMYQAMTIEPNFMRPAILHGFGTSAKRQLPQSLIDLASEGWLPLAASLLGTKKWQPQWMHQNFLPVQGLRLHSKVAPSPLTQDQLLLLCSLWHREGERGRKCAALQQATTLIFGVPTPFQEIDAWERTVQECNVDVLAYAKRAYLGSDVPPLPSPFQTYDEWTAWVLALDDIWHEDELMDDRPLEVHCSGLGGGLLSPDRPYDIFLQNHAQTKVYGPSLAMTDNWDAHVTQIGLTKSVHEYAVYQLLSTAEGWLAWKEFLPMIYAHPQMLLTRAIRLIHATRIRPAHARSPHPTWATAIRQIFRCYHPQAKCLYLKSTFPHLATQLTDCGSREVHIYGFSAGSFTGLALHEILTEYSAFPGRTKVAAIAVPPELMNLATGDREVTLIHCTEDRLCVWRPPSLMELSYQVVLIEGQPTWSGRAKHSYGHLLFLDMASGVHDVKILQISQPEVIPHGLRCEGLLRVLSWVSFDLPTHLKSMVGELLQAAGKGNTDLHTVAVQGRDIRDVQPSNEAELQAAIIGMIPSPGGSQDAGGQIVRDLLVEFLKGFSLRTLLFLLDMVLPQLDAYHAGRHLQHLQPWASVELMQQQLRGQRGTNMHLTYQYEGYAGFHALQMHTEGAPILLFCASTDLPQMTPKELCEAGRLGNMEANVIAGRALLAVMHLPDAKCRCVLLLVHEKVLKGGTSKTPEQRALRRISPVHLDLCAISLPIARRFCGSLLRQYLDKMEYFDPPQDWPQPIEQNMTIPILLEDLVFLGDTRSRYELLVFAQANPAKLPLAMGLAQPDIPARRMANDRKVQLTDALVRILVRLLTPATVASELVHDNYYREYLLPLAAHGDGHVLVVTIAMLLAILTGRSDLCIAGVFGAGKTRSLAVLLIVLSCELPEFTAIVYTKENVAAKALADQLCDLAPPTLGRLGRLIGRIEEGKGAAYASPIDVRCSDRNRIISNRSILIATGGSATAEMAMKYSSFGHWISRAWLAFMDESQQYGNYHEIAALVALQQAMLTVYIGDHRQTPGGLSKGRAAVDNRRKLIQRPLGLRALDRPGDYIPPGQLPTLIAQLWPDASQDQDSDLYTLLELGEDPHQGPWRYGRPSYVLPTSLSRLFTVRVLQVLDVRSSLVAGALATLLIATAPEEFGVPECTTTVEAAGLSGAHRWGIIFPNSSRVSMLTYKAMVAVRYPELVVQEGNHTNIGHFVPHADTVTRGGFRTVLWDVPKDLRLAVEDIVALCEYLRNCHPSLRHGVTSQLLILCNRTAVHNLLLQHGFQTEWHGAMRVSTTSSGAGATSRIAVIVQTGCGFLSGGRRGSTYDDREDCYGRATVALTRAIECTYIVSPPDMAGLIGMAQTLGVYHYGYLTLNRREVEYHGPTSYPSDQTAVLEWGLSSPFTPQDKPPLAIAMAIRAGNNRKWNRYRLVIARKSKLHLHPRVLMAFDDTTITNSGFFPCAMSKEYLYGYATDGYRSPLWLCASFAGSPTLVHARSGFRLSFHQGIQARQVVVLTGIHYFDAHRLCPSLLGSLNMPLERRAHAVTIEEGLDAASASATDIEDSSSDKASTVASDPAYPTVSWCPPIPDAADDPTEQEIASAADQLAILISKPNLTVNPFCNPVNLGVLPHLWLQARMQFTLTAIQEKFSRIIVSIAGELWLRGEGRTIEDVLPRVARSLTVRLAEKLSQALSKMMRLAEPMVTPETECLLYATYWFRPILSELLHTSGESAARNKGRAPSGPVKVLVTDRKPKRRQNVVDVCSGASSLLAWFPASWASKIAPEFLKNPTENGLPQIQDLACRKRAGADEGDRHHKLQAVRFSAKDMPFFDLDIDSAIRDGDYFAELIQGYSDNLIDPNIMRALQPIKPCRTALEVIIPSKDGLSPEQWKETATLCPLDWPSNYSLLRLWHMQGSLQQTENDLRLQTGRSHMFTSWTVHYQLFAERVLLRKPPIFEAASVLQNHIRNGNFPQRRLRQRPPAEAVEAHQVALNQMRQNAEARQRIHPVNFELPNEWTDTVTADKRYHREYQSQGLTG